MAGALVMWSQANFQGQVDAVEDEAITTTCTEVPLATGARSAVNLTTAKTVAFYATLSDCTNNLNELARLRPLGGLNQSADFGRQAFFFKQVA